MKLGLWLSLVLILNYSCTLVPALHKTKVGRSITNTTPLLNAQQSMSDQPSYGAIVDHETATELQSTVGHELSQDRVGLLFDIVEDPHPQENAAKPQEQDELLAEQFGSLTRFALGDTPVPPASTSAHSSGTGPALRQKILVQTCLEQTRLGQTRLGVSSQTDPSLARLELRRGSSGELEALRRSRYPQQPQVVVGGPSQGASGSPRQKHMRQRSKSCNDLAQQLQQESQTPGGIGLVEAPERPSPELQRAGSGTHLRRGVQVKNQDLAQATPETGLLGRGRESLWKKIRGPLLLCSVLSVIGIGHGLLNNSLSKGEWNQHFYATSWLEWEIGAGFNLFAVMVSVALHYQLQVFKSMSPMTQQLLGIPLAAACCSASPAWGVSPRAEGASSELLF